MVGNNQHKGNGKEYELIEFPCTFPIKVMGKKDSTIKEKALAIIRTHCPDYTDLPNERLSRDNNYIALTFTIQAQSKSQLDKIYAELTQCPEVLMAL